ncbi:signal recognition particle, SRP9/SRP14 subunit [Rhizodiscina lignyota]|uniref:Signal recognition particle subunit SRP14 n=1 Tax=Rhizodiscina lignyota TaxID=1504668 RepID=A0A9P4ILI4_9PEZI|nr:signal recognition particle, SRP9/SRP14 subunit [Rhizodiscina lignyota]
MSSSHLSHDEFFTKLGELFEANRQAGKGSIFLTQKRLNYDTPSLASTPTTTPDDPLRDLHPESPLPVIIRASNGKWKDEKASKIKLSTIVQPDALEGFYIRYADVCKGGMQALKKRDRSKRKRDKAKKKKGSGAADGDKKG